MTITALLFAIHLHIDLTTLLRSAGTRTHSGKPVMTVTCGIRVVGFRFEGVEGQRLRLNGVVYTIGRQRVLELLSSGETTYECEGKTLPLMVWPADGFGFVHVPMPQPANRSVQ